MGEVGVDPQRVAQAASALEELRDALAANVPVIVNTMSSYGSPVNTGVLKQAQSRAPGDASDMRSRARLAALWLAQNVNIDGQGLVDIPWDHQSVDAADASAEAQALADAEANKDPKAALAAIKAIQQDLQDHTVAGDKAFLAAFWSQSGAAAAAANLATTLHNQDGSSGTTVLTTSDQQILATFASSLAYTTKNNLLDPQQSKQLVSDFSNTRDPWSVAMLLSSVPGSSYGTGANSPGANLLTGVTEHLLAALQHGGYTIPLNIRTMEHEPSNGDLQAAVARYDPLAAMLRSETQNGTAAEQTMAGYNPLTGKVSASDGQAWAHMLMTSHTIYAPVWPGSPGSPGSPSDPTYFRVLQGYGPPPFASGPAWNGYTIDQNIVGKFLDASTAGPHGAGGPMSTAAFSAQAAVNLIDATPSPNGDGGFKVSGPVRHALLDTAQRYLLDLAKSTINPGNSSIEIPASDMPIWHILVNGQGNDTNSNTALSRFLQQICSDKGDAATLNATAKITFGNIYAQTQQGTLPSWFNGSHANNAMAGLLGRIATEANNDGIDLAKDTDAQHAEYNTMLNLGEYAVQFIPGAGGTLSKAQTPVTDALALCGIPTQFSTDNAAAAEQVDSHNFAVQSTQLHVTMVQGLLNNNAGDLLTDPQAYEQAHPGSGSQFLQGNQIVLTQGNYSAFQDWYQNLNPGLDKKYGLSSLESRYSYYYNQQGGTSSDGGTGVW